MRKIGRAVAVATFLSVLCGLFGCSKAPEYMVKDIQSVSVSCGHMDYSHSYSFYLRKTEKGWLLDADYATDTEQFRMEYEACQIAEEDAKELLKIVQEQKVIEKMQKYKKPKIRVWVSDETTYYTSIGFTDGETLGAATLINRDLETCFYRLAGKYAGVIPETNDIQTNTEEGFFEYITRI